MKSMEIHRLIQKTIDYYQDGNFKQAENICKAILELQPENAFVLNFLGVLFYQQGNYDSAIDYIKKALYYDPNNPDAYNHLGSALKAKGQPGEAIACYQKALELNPQDADIYFNLGNTFVMKRQLDEAINCYKKAIQYNPNLAAAYNNLGNTFQEQKRYNEAITHYQIALQINPDLADAHLNLGNIYLEKGQYNEAIKHYQETLKLNPSHFESYLNLGTIFQKQGKLDEAITCYQKAIKFNPQFAGNYYNLGIAFQDKRLLDEALGAYKKTIEFDPEFAEAHFSISWINLLLGNFKEGWKGYEWRWKLKEAYQRNFSQLMWDGSDIRGCTILLHAEQGFGDTIQFIRYAPLVAQRGAKVIVECQKELTSLLKNTEGINQIVSYGEPLPDFDIQCPLLSLPLVFNTTLESIPAKIPYISADPLSIEKWKGRIKIDKEKTTIGLVWAGSTTTRKEGYYSCSLEAFAPFAHLNNITLYSLQKGQASEQVAKPPNGMKLIDYTEEIHDFSDTAAFIINLDLIISVDTAVAHLAGAIGRPVWTLLRFSPEWRWMLDRMDSPWYPTMRLFRQPAPGDWGCVIGKVFNQLQTLIHKDKYIGG
jgi:tetratricopeptide (TPR) repeat protein